MQSADRCAINHVSSKQATVAAALESHVRFGGWVVSSSDQSADSKGSAFCLKLHGAVISLDGKQCVESDASRDALPVALNGAVSPQRNPSLAAAHALGVQLGQKLKAAGADVILAQIKGK
jgi:hypothetical protein